MPICTLGYLKKLCCSSRKFMVLRAFGCKRFLSSNEDSPKYFTEKYKIFKDEDSDIIFDVEEERLKKQKEVEVLTEGKRISHDLKIHGLSSGVIKVQELVELVKSNKGKDVIVMKLPPDLKYANFMVICSGISRRHLNGVAELIRKNFKHKISPTEGTLKMEGANSDWIAMDLGNIILHLMMESTRKVYDLESLWAVGAKYDLKINTKDDKVLELLKSHTMNLDDLNPAKGTPNM